MHSVHTKFASNRCAYVILRDVFYSTDVIRSTLSCANVSTKFHVLLSDCQMLAHTQYNGTSRTEFTHGEENGCEHNVICHVGGKSRRLQSNFVIDYFDNFHICSNDVELRGERARFSTRV